MASVKDYIKNNYKFLTVATLVLVGTVASVKSCNDTKNVEEGFDDVGAKVDSVRVEIVQNQQVIADKVDNVSKKVDNVNKNVVDVRDTVNAIKAKLDTCLDCGNKKPVIRTPIMRDTIRQANPRPIEKQDAIINENNGIVVINNGGTVNIYECSQANKDTVRVDSVKTYPCAAKIVRMHVWGNQR